MTVTRWIAPAPRSPVAARWYGAAVDPALFHCRAHPSSDWQQQQLAAANNCWNPARNFLLKKQ